ncbi:MAG: hypothetical protein KY391_01710 [Actinobacteria bacterium]|nr:hypothetical protein [Actinomycetota bacterium]
MRTLIVLNPASGGSSDVPVGGLVAAAGPGAAAISPRSLSSFRAEVTAAARGVDRIVVAGGDGTFNCALNAFDHRFASVVWGLIPAGTGNDLARTLGVPDDPFAALDVALGDTTREIDVGIARGEGVERLFINACMGGFPVQVDEKTNEEMKERFGPFAFWVAGARAAAKLERTTVTVNGTDLDDCVAVGVGNGRTCGGGIEVFPNADPSDGLLDACAVAIPRPTSAAKLIPRLLRGTHEGIDEVTTTQAATLEIASDPPVELNVDGDLVGLKTPVRFEVAGRLTIAA